MNVRVWLCVYEWTRECACSSGTTADIAGDGVASGEKVYMGIHKSFIWEYISQLCTNVKVWLCVYWRKRECAVCCSVLQCVAVCCSVLQCVAVCCSVLQCVAVCWLCVYWRKRECACSSGTTADAATHCNILQHTASHCNTLQQCEAVCCSMLQCVAAHCNILQHTMLQCVAAHCNTLQHTASPTAAVDAVARIQNVYQ